MPSYDLLAVDRDGTLLNNKGEISTTNRDAIFRARAADPALTSDHKRAATVYCQLKDGRTRVTDLYARWAELDAMRSGG